jgi:hypothetical protein
MPMPEPAATPTDPTEPTEPVDTAGQVRRLAREVVNASAGPLRPNRGFPGTAARVALAEAAGLLPRRPATPRRTGPADQPDSGHEHGE